MPLYDCMLLLKPHVKKEALMDLVAKVGKHVYRKNGVLTDLKSFGTVQLGYGIKKLDGRYYQGQLMQMTMMTPPSLNNELHYLNKEDRLLRWLLVKHRDIKFGFDLLGEDDDDGKSELNKIRSNLYEDEEEEEDDDNDDDEEYNTNETEINKVYMLTPLFYQFDQQSSTHRTISKNMILFAKKLHVVLWPTF